MTLKRYMDTYIPAIMTMSRPWRGLPCVPRPCWRKSERTFMTMNTDIHSCLLNVFATHPSYSSVRDEARCKAAYEAAHLQGTHVSTACEQHSWCQTTLSCKKTRRGNGQLKHVPMRAVWPFSCMRNSCPQSVAAVFTPNTTK